VTSDEERAEMTRRWEGLKLDVAHAGLENDVSFFRSMSVWLPGADEPDEPGLLPRIDWRD
jgi:hypothetical protein